MLSALNTPENHPARDMHDTFYLDEKKQNLSVNPSDRISKVLREDLGLMGTKVGCNAGDCGSCTVLINEEPVCACLVPAAKIQNTKIQTIEGLSEKGINDLQKSFLRYGAAQCGICTPGLLISATALLKNKLINIMPTRLTAIPHLEHS